MSRFLRAAALATALAVIPAIALAAPPEREVTDLNAPAEDVAESAFVSGLCKFPIEADVSGHVMFTLFPDHTSRRVLELHHFGVRVTYVNPANGMTVRLRDIGPDRLYLKDGVPFVAVTGRSETGTGNVGVFKINLETGEVVHEAGREIGVIYDRICQALS